MLEKLKNEVYSANMKLTELGLVINTWGNVSGRDPETGLVVIKPSGVEYSELKPSDLPVLDLEGKIVEGDMRPSSDTPTHLALYRAFPCIGGVTHTHSMYAVAFAQAGRSIPALGTTHADYFPGDVPCTRPLTPSEIAGDYEAETGKVIVEAIEKIGADRMRAALVFSHGPFTWGQTAAESVDVSYVMEVIAEMAYRTEMLHFAGNSTPLMQNELLFKHFDRKHGPGAYYGQIKK